MPRSPDPLLLPADQTPLKSPRSFGDGAVGLGIVAAMSAVAVNSKPIAAPPRSEPIPIVSSSPRPRGDAGETDEDEEELSESYTCVISHVAGSTVRKRVYFDDGSDGVRSSGVFLQSPPVMKTGDLMNGCTKKLHGLDIFMYRGDKAFCSPCRSGHIMNDEYMENCSSGAYGCCSVSPLLFSAGVAAT